MSLIENTTNQPAITVDPNAIDRRTGKPKRLSKRVQTAIRLILRGDVKTQKEAADHVKMNESHLSAQMHSPTGQAFIARERSKTISLGSLRAARRAIELIDAASEHVSADMTKHVLAIEGIKPVEAGQPIGATQINVGYIINLTRNEAPQPDATHMPHIREIEANPLK